MIECPRCGSCVRHERAAHECGERPDPYRAQHPWFGFTLRPDGTEEVVHEETHYRLADGSYIRKDEL
jgi:hypothetical protein